MPNKEGAGGDKLKVLLWQRRLRVSGKADLALSTTNPTRDHQSSSQEVRKQRTVEFPGSYCDTLKFNLQKRIKQRPDRTFANSRE